MYKFIDTTPQNCHYEEHKPISAMNYKGKFLEDYIDGYTTLSVDGREMLNVDFSYDSLSVGSMIIYSRLPQRVLTVHYQLKNKDPEKLLKEYRKLMNFLYTKKPVAIWFNDELDVYYEGVFTSSQMPPGDVTSVVSSFDIVCPNPLKKTVKTFVSDNGEIGINTPLKTIPVKIEVKATENGLFTLTNGRNKIYTQTNVVKVGDTATVLIEQGKFLINNANKTSELNLKSDFENFDIRQGDKLECNQGKVKVTYKGVSL